MQRGQDASQRSVLGKLRVRTTVGMSRCCGRVEIL